MKIAYSILFLALLAACSNQQRREIDLEKNLEAHFSSLFQEDEPGASICILKNGEVLFARSYGLADLQSKEAISSSTLFNLGSISKPFVAYGILILRDEGKLSLDDPLSKYFRGFKNESIAEKVKIKHLLTHTSGLPDLRKVRAEREFYLVAKDEENWAPIMQADTLLFEPGERYEYSNPAFNALALIIEQVSGTRWQAFIEDRIFKPAGMHNSTITDGPHPETGVAHGYEKNEGQWHELDYGEEPTFAAAGNGGVWSSIDELVLFEQAIQQAVFAKVETLAESRTVQAPANWSDSTPPFIAWSWFIEENAGNIPTIAHTGTQGGFYCHYVLIPGKQILYIVLANRIYPREESFDVSMALLQQANWLD